MPIQIVVVPDLGGAETVEVIDLGLASGDVVALEDSLLVLESDKAAMDMPSPVAGAVSYTHLTLPTFYSGSITVAAAPVNKKFNYLISLHLKTALSTTTLN